MEKKKGKDKFSGIEVFKNRNIDAGGKNETRVAGPHPMADMTLESREEVRPIKIDIIDPDPYQARQHFDEDELKDLAESIKEKGVIQPVVLVRNGNRFTLKVGERRWRASQIAGKKTIPAIIKENNIDTEEIGLIENAQRVGLSPLEESLEIKRLIDKKGYQQKEIAVLLGNKVTKGYISQAVKIAKFAESYGDIPHLASLKDKNGHKLCREHWIKIAYQPTFEESAALLKAIIDGNITTTQEIRKAKSENNPWTGRRIISRLKSFNKSLRMDFISVATIAEDERLKVSEAIDKTIEQLRSATVYLENVKNKFIVNGGQ